MNTKLFLLLGTSLSFIPYLTFAQCVATQDCATLGYTETSCSGGKGVKCPFGNKWACFKSDAEYEKEFCDKYGFTLSCTGSNQTGGASKACNSKYNYCTCAEGYEWNSGSCQKKAPDYNNCMVGTLFHSDNTCSWNKVSGKTILGVVIMEKTSSANGWIMTVHSIPGSIVWSPDFANIPGLNDITSESGLTDIQASCTNTDAITAYGNSSKYPVAWAAKNYKPSGTPSGKTWCLPSGGLLNSALNNDINLARINAGISAAGGRKIGFGLSEPTEHVWSSSEYDDYSVWNFCAGKEGSFGMCRDTKTNYGVFFIRPVLAF